MTSPPRATGRPGREITVVVGPVWLGTTRQGTLASIVVSILVNFVLEIEAGLDLGATVSPSGAAPR